MGKKRALCLGTSRPRASRAGVDLGYRRVIQKTHIDGGRIGRAGIAQIGSGSLNDALAKKGLGSRPALIAMDVKSEYFSKRRKLAVRERRLKNLAYVGNVRLD